MKKILSLIKGLGKGGAEQLLATAAPYLDTDRFSYEIAYLLPWKDAMVGELEAAGIRCHCLNGGAGLGWIGRLKDLAINGQIDLLHAHSPYPAVGARLFLGSSIPIVYTEHSNWARYRKTTYWGNAVTFAKNSHVFTVSDDIRKSLHYPAPIGFLPMPPVETLHHGLDPEAVSKWNWTNGIREELAIPADAPVVGTVANFTPKKGYVHLLRAADKVRKVVPDVRFVLVGQGPLQEEIRALAQSLQLDDTVIFTGFRDDAPRVMSSFDVFTLSSLHEGLSIALLEAMALGKPSVVTDVGGLPEVIEHGKHGWLLPPSDPDRLADGIISLLQDRELREAMGVAAKLRSRDFDIRQAVRRSEEVYEDLLR